MTYCDRAAKATITISINNQIIEKVISNYPAVDITVIHGQSAQIQGEGLNSDTCGGLGNYAIREYNGFVELVSFTYQHPSNNKQCPASKLLVNGVWVNPSLDVYYPGSASIIRQYSSDWVLTVVDAIGRITVRKYSTEPTYTVSCDDDCPDGYLRCECNEYPGYCCIPCSEIRNEIASATAILRGING